MNSNTSYQSHLQYNAPNSIPQTTVCFGICPSGTMRVTSGRVPGYLELQYVIPAAQQRLYHPHPNTWHSSIQRVAYLPDTPEGRDILFRFQFAFLNGLCFSVGRSLTTARNDQVTWSQSLPHKTGTVHGPHHFSFPDPTYLPTASLALDRLGVPNDPQACRQWIQQHQAPSQPVAPPMGNGNMGTVVIPPFRMARGTRGPRSSASNNSEVIYYNAESSPSAANANDQYSKCLEVVSFGNNEDTKAEECPICLEMMVSDPTTDENTVVCIKKCRHRFHKKCILDMFQLNHTNCPNCREPVGIEQRGHGPSGSMSISMNPNMFCKGYENDSNGTIVLRYTIASGIQLPFMENPGTRYSGATREAYLPDNEAGRKLLSRLKYAFTHGYTFRVGTSLTTGRPNQTTWTSIHHKTSLNYGVHGYPDPNYIANCNSSLDALRIPNAQDCS